jgi:hypothetical protein
MRFPWAEAWALVSAVSAARPALSQQGREIGLEAVVTSSDPAVVVAGAYGALRGAGRTRFSALAGGGLSAGEFAWRAEALGHFMLSPLERRRWGAYLAGGVAAVGGQTTRGYLVLTLGVEQRPGGSSGWAAEAGVGGGARVAIAYRWRRLHLDRSQ